MSDVNPGIAGETILVATPAKEAWTLTVLKVAWPTLAALLVVTTVILALALPDRMPVWISAMPFLSGIVVAMGAAAFGGPAIKRAQEARNGNGG